MTLMVLATACGGSTGSTTVTTGAGTASTTTSSAAPGQKTWFDDLAAGICFDSVFDGDDFDFSTPPAIVPCDGPHDNEIAAMVDIPAGAGGSYPGEEAVNESAAEACDTAFEAHLGRPLGDTYLAAFVVWPDESDWSAGARQAVCSVYAEEPLHGTAFSGSLVIPGETLAVLYEVDGVLDVWLMDGGTGELTRNLTGGEPGDILSSQPSWAPDGSAVGFAALGVGGEGDLFLALVDEDGVLPLLEAEGSDDRPVIAPVATKVAFISDRDGDDFDIYVLDVDAGGQITRLTDHLDRDSSPTWSPDGSQIAFRRRTDGNSDIFVMNADGSDVRQLTDNPAFDGDPIWSPDGAEILFTSDRAGDFDIWVMSADGSDQVALTDHPASDEYPTWSRDGEYIAFQSTRHGATQIWVMRWDGSDQSLLALDAPTGYPMFAPVAIGE
ncbi:MAG: septum formation family protein [Acidimicrobiia bacterium]